LQDRSKKTNIIDLQLREIEKQLFKLNQNFCSEKDKSVQNFAQSIVSIVVAHSMNEKNEEMIFCKRRQKTNSFVSKVSKYIYLKSLFNNIWNPEEDFVHCIIIPESLQPSL
jgi:hypothetical protein